MRHVFVADDGYILFARDYEQLEMRIMAHLSREPALIDAINSGRDVHCATAAIMYGEPYEEILAAKRHDDEKNTPEKLPLSDREKVLLKYRKGAKTLNFGILYGMGTGKLANELGISIEEARATIDRYFDAVPRVKTYFALAIDKARQTGYSVTLLGRQRQLPDLHSPYSGLRARAERQVKNAPVQGFASEITKMAMNAIWCDDYITATGTQMLVQVHDEILFRIPIAYANDKRLHDTIERHMAEAVGLKLLVRLDTSAKQGQNWRQCK